MTSIVSVYLFANTNSLRQHIAPFQSLVVEITTITNNVPSVFNFFSKSLHMMKKKIQLAQRFRYSDLLEQQQICQKSNRNFFRFKFLLLFCGLLRWQGHYVRMIITTDWGRLQGLISNTSRKNHRFHQQKAAREQFLFRVYWLDSLLLLTCILHSFISYTLYVFSSFFFLYFVFIANNWFFQTNNKKQQNMTHVSPLICCFHTKPTIIVKNNRLTKKMRMIFTVMIIRDMKIMISISTMMMISTAIMIQVRQQQLIQS